MSFLEPRGCSLASGLDPRGHRDAHPSEFIKSSRHLSFDTGKNTLHLVGLDGRRAIVLRRLATAPAALSAWQPAVARATSPGGSEHLGMTSPYPSVDRPPCRLKANEPAGLSLADIGSVNRIAVGRHVIDAQCDEVKATQFAVNGEIEHGQVPRAFLQIQLGAYRPHVTGPQGRLLGQ